MKEEWFSGVNRAANILWYGKIPRSRYNKFPVGGRNWLERYFIIIVVTEKLLKLGAILNGVTAEKMTYVKV